MKTTIDPTTLARVTGGTAGTAEPRGLYRFGEIRFPEGVTKPPPLLVWTQK